MGFESNSEGHMRRRANQGQTKETDRTRLSSSSCPPPATPPSCFPESPVACQGRFCAGPCTGGLQPQSGPRLPPAPDSSDRRPVRGQAVRFARLDAGFAREVCHALVNANLVALGKSLGKSDVCCLVPSSRLPRRFCSPSPHARVGSRSRIVAYQNLFLPSHA